MERELEGRVALVTGASAGIGEAIARRFAAAGARVALVARGAERLAAAAANLDRSAGAPLEIAADVTRPDTGALAVERTIRAFGRLDILVNNAGGVGPAGPFAALTDADWQAGFDLNLMSAVRMTRAAHPHLDASGHGRLLMISSIFGLEPSSAFADYGAMKAALLNLTRYLAREFAPRVLVNAITPGAVWSESWESSTRELARTTGRPRDEIAAETQRAVAQGIDLGRLGNPGDIAEMALFLAGDRAAWTTGAGFVVDGGTVRRC